MQPFSITERDIIHLTSSLGQLFAWEQKGLQIRKF